MTAFWEGLSLFSKILFCTALASTTVLVIQIIMLIIGFTAGSLGDVDGFDGDVDADGDGIVDGGEGVGMFTLKGVVAFFSIGGWVGLAMDMADIHPAITVLVALVAGALALIGVGFLYKGLYKLQSNGNVTMNNAIGKTAEVYLTIPANGENTGKVSVTVQERFIEAEARTMGESIPTGTLVKVVDVINDVLIVEPLNK